MANTYVKVKVVSDTFYAQERCFQTYLKIARVKGAEALKSQAQLNSILTYSNGAQKSALYNKFTDSIKP